MKRAATIYTFSRPRVGKIDRQYRLIVYPNEGGSELERKSSKGWRSVSVVDRTAWSIAANVKRAADAGASIV